MAKNKTCICIALLFIIIFVLYYTLLFAREYMINTPSVTSSELPPVAKKIPHVTKVHDQELIDNYHWMRDYNWPKVKDKEVLEYLKAENKYAEDFFSRYSSTIQMIYRELLGRVKLADKSVPVRDKNYYYYSVTHEDSDYAIHMRRRDEKNAEEVVIFDENKESQNHNYFRVGAMSISPDENLMVYAIDTTGDEHFNVKIKNLSTNEILTDSLKNVLGDIVWNETGEGFYYQEVDNNWRPNKLYYHKLGTDQKLDKLIYQELDDTFRIGISKTSDYKYIAVEVSSSDSSEVRYIKSDDLFHKLEMFIPRREGHLCSIDHFNGHFYIHTNDTGRNFRLVRISDEESAFDNSNGKRVYMDLKDSEELIPHSDDVYLTDFNLYDNHIVIETREMGLAKINVMDYNMQNRHPIEYPEDAYTASVVYSCNDDDGMMFHYSSMVSPSSILKYNFADKSIKTLKVQEIPSGYNKAEYMSERIFITSREDADVKIPVSLVYKKDLFKKDGSNPLFLHSYGSYGISIAPDFSSGIISLLDRGFVYAIAHIRGGDDLGFSWYEDAKFLHKRRTFNDFIDVADGLVASKYTSSGDIAIAGGSAGGMLMGVAINERPDLFKAVIADVPFVDVLNTMLDSSLPLTPGEFKEWGNPQEIEYFNYIKSYSPYENVGEKNYPSMYVLAGLNDPRVTYWEPSKWVAKLRDMKKDDNLLILETDMETGHGGKSARFERFEKSARKFAFILSVFGKL